MLNRFARAWRLRVAHRGRRRAYELAFATTYMFGGLRPSFLKVDEITFTRPVDVGDLLRLTSTVVHATHADEQNERVRN